MILFLLFIRILFHFPRVIFFFSSFKNGYRSNHSRSECKQYLQNILRHDLRERNQLTLDTYPGCVGSISELLYTCIYNLLYHILYLYIF